MRDDGWWWTNNDWPKKTPLKFGFVFLIVFQIITPSLFGPWFWRARFKWLVTLHSRHLFYYFPGPLHMKNGSFGGSQKHCRQCLVAEGAKVPDGERKRTKTGCFYPATSKCFWNRLWDQSEKWDFGSTPLNHQVKTPSGNAQWVLLPGIFGWVLQN